MRKLTILAFFLFACLSAFAQINVGGKVTDAATQEALIGVSIKVKDRLVGTVTNMEGNFNLSVQTNQPFVIQISMVGYEMQEVEVAENKTDIAIALKEQTVVSKEVVVSASRIEEDVMKSPISVEKMDILAVRTTPSISYLDAMVNQRGVDVMSSSMLVKSVNTRGFNAPYNVRFIQRVDGAEMQSVAFSVPLANILGVSDIDIESSEIIPGTASALYGPNAFNGIMNITSKNPYDYQGLSAQTKLGMNHLGDEGGAKLFTDFAIRYAKAFNNKFAFKVNLAYTGGTDWYADNMDDLNATPNASGQGINPMYNGVHSYGDENSVGMVGGENIARTGYTDKDLVDYSIKNLKTDASLHYRFSDKLEANYTFKYADYTSPVQGANRYIMDGVQFMMNRLELKGANFYLRGYALNEDIKNKSYDSRVMGIVMNELYNPSGTWIQEYKNAFDGLVEGYSAGNHNEARRYADRNRLVAGTQAFEDAKKVAFNPAQTKGKYGLYHVEGQYDLSKQVKVFDLLIGGNFRQYRGDSDGRVYADAEKRVADFYEFGFLMQASKSLMDDKLKLTAAVRYDKSQYFDGLPTPRLSAVYAINDNHSIRLAYQTGFRSPIMQDQSIDINLGTLQLIGGKDGLLPGNPVHNNSVDIGSYIAFMGSYVQDLNNGLSSEAAAKKNYSLLKKANINFIKPERMKSVEIGYRGVFADRVNLDVSYHYSIYNDFIGYVAVMNLKDRPLSDSLVGISPSRLYLVYTNSDKEVYSQGVSLSASVALGKGYNFTSNGSWIKLYKRDDRDPMVAAFNTPPLRFNVGINNRHVTKNIGFNINYRWQSEFDYEFAFLPPGYLAKVPSFGTLDAQVSYRFKKYLALKVGATNALNTKYYQAYGAPTIGGMYYLSLTFDEMLR